MFKAQSDEVMIALPPSVFTKILLLNTMIEQNISNVELAKRTKVKPQEVQRIANLAHSTKIDTIARALFAVGKRLEISIV